MRQKVHPDCIRLSVLIMSVLLFTLLLAQPINAGRGIVLRPPFNGTHRVTAYFDHDRPTY